MPHDGGLHVILLWPQESAPFGPEAKSDNTHSERQRALHMTRPSYWQLVWDEAQPKLIKWADVTGKEVCNNIPRVGQLDAELLDEELTQTLQEPLAKAFNLINVSIFDCPHDNESNIAELVSYKTRT